MWEHFHHQADIGIRGIGESLEEAFEEAAVSMVAVICDPETIEAKEQIQITCEGADKELLLADWLNAVIYEMATRNMLYSKFKVRLEAEKLTAQAWGERADPEKHDMAVEVKAATYSQLAVENQDGRWTAQCVVDV